MQKENECLSGARGRGQWLLMGTGLFWGNENVLEPCYEGGRTAGNLPKPLNLYFQ